MCELIYQLIPSLDVNNIERENSVGRIISKQSKKKSEHRFNSYI